MENTKVRILLVEDSAPDRELTERVMKKVFKRPYQLDMAVDGKDAIEYLVPHPKAETKWIPPDLILLDLNLPVIDGWEVLEYIKNHEDLCHIPVIVLSTSNARKDIERAYRLHANGYITKPLGLDRFIEIIRSIESYWFEMCELPV